MTEDEIPDLTDAELEAQAGWEPADEYEYNFPETETRH